MGCGGSKNVVAVVDGKPPILLREVTQKNDILLAASPNKCEEIDNETIVDEDYDKSESCLSENSQNSNRADSLQTINVSSTSVKPVRKSTNGSSDSLSRDEKKREKSANSVCSGDSGVFDEAGRTNSDKKQVSSAHRKLLRLEGHTSLNGDSTNNCSLNVAEETQLLEPTILHRAKSRFGNEAFDIALNTPDTGNAKKRPEKLAALTNIHERRSKKRMKTKADIDRKMMEAEARRKIRETEKQIKAKQFQHFSVHTKVEEFHCEDHVS